MSNVRSPALRDLAQEVETCQFCGAYAKDQIVLCHPNGLRYGKGISLKAHDLGAYGCPTCHGILDGRIPSDLDRAGKELMFLRGFYNSMLWLFQEGHIRVIR